MAKQLYTLVLKRDDIWRYYATLYQGDEDGKVIASAGRETKFGARWWANKKIKALKRREKGQDKIYYEFKR